MGIVKDFADSIFEEASTDSVKRKLLIENRDKLRENLKHFKIASNDNDSNLELIFVKLDLENNSNIKKLSMVKDTYLYDIIETYEFKKRIFHFEGDFSKVWESIYKELTISDEYGPAIQPTINKLKEAFDKVVECVQDCVDYRYVFFENFARNVTTDKLILL